MGLRLKRYKFLHWIYNLLHYRSLSHNRAAYRKYDIRLPVIASISSRNFPDKQSRAWLDTGDSRELAPARPTFNAFSPAIRNGLLKWSENGYLIIGGCFSDAETDEIQQEVDRLVARQQLRPTHDNKLLFANRRSQLIRKVACDPRLTGLLGFILDKEVVPFQTINFIRGSNQRAHSDSIHTTTYPLGYLIAVWIALEDTNAGNGSQPDQKKHGHPLFRHRRDQISRDHRTAIAPEMKWPSGRKPRRNRFAKRPSPARGGSSPAQPLAVRASVLAYHG